MLIGVDQRRLGHICYQKSTKADGGVVKRSEGITNLSNEALGRLGVPQSIRWTAHVVQ